MSDQELNEEWTVGGEGVPLRFADIEFPEPNAPLRARVEAIEARQRAQGVHDPDCARTLAVVAFYARRDIYTARAFDAEHEEAVATPCDCWLSREKGYLAGLAGALNAVKNISLRLAGTPPQDTVSGYTRARTDALLAIRRAMTMSEHASTDVGTVNGVMDFGSPIIHIARKFRTALCGAGTQGNVVPIGAVRLDDPHLCTDCKQMRAGRDDL